jgi:peptidoglycan/LPS O-acetylase OafA/YrhL
VSDTNAQPRQPGRDAELDLLRGFAILWVLIIHCLFWTGVGSGQVPRIAKSFLLFEMPLLFLLAGASNALGKPRGWVGFALARGVRILVPYWVYAAVCFLFLLAFSTPTDSTDRVTQAFQWAIASPPRVEFLTWHLWFIPVYLVAIMAVPGFLMWYRRVGPAGRWAMPAALLGGVPVIEWLRAHAGLHSLVQTIWFYLFWLYLGIAYRDILAGPLKGWRAFALGLICWAIVGSLIAMRIYPADMQANKFPPNTAFLFLNLGYLAFFLAFRPLLLSALQLGPIAWALRPFAKRGYTMYLWHPWAFVGASHLQRESTGAWWPTNRELSFLAYLSLVLVWSMIAGAAFGWAEEGRWGRRRKADPVR